MSIKGSRKLITKEVAQDANQYLGRRGEVWFQEGTQTLRFGDDVTVGGQPLSGGGGNTGLVTFDGVQVIGAGTGSGDGNGYATLELVPDANLYNNDQYIIVDPTAPSHIHLRAGGTQDGSAANLFLGGEINNVRVVDNYGVALNQGSFNTNFTLVEQGTDYDTAVWSTDEDGNHWIDITITNPSAPARGTEPISGLSYNFPQYPQNRIEIYDGTNYIDVSAAGATYSMGNPYQLRLDVAQAPPANPTTIVSMTYRLVSLNQSFLLLENNNLEVSVAQDVTVFAEQTIQLFTGTGNLRITTDDSGSGPSWYFTAQGYLQFPQGLAPTTSKGQDGDEAGSVVFDGDYIYYCTTDWTDGVADIWKRVAWSADTW